MPIANVCTCTNIVPTNEPYLAHALTVRLDTTFRSMSLPLLASVTCRSVSLLVLASVTCRSTSLPLHASFIPAAPPPAQLDTFCSGPANLLYNVTRAVCRTGLPLRTAAPAAAATGALAMSARAVLHLKRRVGASAFAMLW